ncbi:TonB-dependent receptor [Ursidibacter sp. B-7004-1]
MKFKHNILYTSLFASLSFSLFAQEQTSNNALDEVSVVSELEKFKATEKLKADVNLSLLGRQLAFLSPITVVNYDEKAFADKEPRNIVDVLAKTDASVMNFGGETNTLQGVYVRGLQLDARQFSVNGLAGLYSAYNTPTSAVGSAQLIKGASTATVGMDPEGSSGASINIETKRATDEDINKLGFAWFSDSRLQESFDIGRRFGTNKEWGIRVSGKYRDGDTARKDYDERAKEIAIGADYRGDKLRVGLDYMQNKRKTDGSRARIQDMQNFTYAIPAAPSGETNLNPSWLGQTTSDQTAMATFEYDLPYNMTLSGGFGHMESRYYGAFGQITSVKQNGEFSVTDIRGINFVSRTTSGNLKLQGEFDTGAVSHHWNLAFDSVVRQRDHDRSGSTSISGGTIYQPSFASLSNNVDLTPNTQNTDNKLSAKSLAIADTLGFVDNSIRLTLGGRFQWIEQLNRATNKTLKADRFSPMVTLAYVANPDLVFYGNYLEDLEPGSADPETGEMNSPRVTKQLEAGVRKNWDDLVTTTLSVYQISRPGIIRGNTNVLKGRAGKEQGKERNRGVEFNIYANLLEKTLRPSLGIAYNQGKVFDFPTYADQIVSGVQVTSPRVILKANLEWDTPFARNLTLNAGLQHYGKSYQDTAAKYKLPSYTTVDAGAKYSVKFAGNQEVVVRAGVENLFNKNYWQVQRGQYDRSFAVLGMPRTYWVKTEYSF